MADLLFLVIIVAFFSLAVLLVHGCDRLVGPDDESPPVDDQSIGTPVGARS